MRIILPPSAPIHAVQMWACALQASCPQIRGVNDSIGQHAGMPAYAMEMDRGVGASSAAAVAAAPVQQVYQPPVQVQQVQQVQQVPSSDRTTAAAAAANARAESAELVDSAFNATAPQAPPQQATELPSKGGGGPQSLHDFLVGVNLSQFEGALAEKGAQSVQ